MTEEIAATPGWVDARLDQVFANLPDPGSAQADYARCLATAKAPAAPSDLLGTEFERCRTTLLAAMAQTGLDDSTLATLGQNLEALEADLAAES